MSRMFFFGYGYVAQHLARVLKEAGWEMAGTTRNADNANRMWAEGVEPHVWDGESKMEAPLRVMKGVTHILHSIPPQSGGDVVMQNHVQLLTKIAPQIQWYGYLSTTGVYGFTPEGEVTEDYAVNPETNRGKLRSRVEKTHQKLFKKIGVPVHVFRLAAIYGPGRGPLERVRQGQQRYVISEDHQVNRIHVDDIVQVLLASMNKPNPGGVYNVVDDEPANSEDPILLAAKLLGVDPPRGVPYEQAEENLGPGLKSHFAANRHISNQRIKDELGVKLHYPTYREGFEALTEQLKAAGQL